jgi:hypothetical protein
MKPFDPYKKVRLSPELRQRLGSVYGDEIDTATLATLALPVDNIAFAADPPADTDGRELIRAFEAGLSLNALPRDRDDNGTCGLDLLQNIILDAANYSEDVKAEIIVRFARLFGNILDADCRVPPGLGVRRK